MQRLLRETNPTPVLVDTLLIISQLARISRDGASTYEPINSAAMLPNLRRLLGHADAGVRARVCNLVGNMCRHSAFFYAGGCMRVACIGIAVKYRHSAASVDRHSAASVEVKWEDATSIPGPRSYIVELLKKLTWWSSSVC